MLETRNTLPQTPQRFVSAVNLDHCLAGVGCIADPEAAKLKFENERLSDEIRGLQTQFWMTPAQETFV